MRGIKSGLISILAIGLLAGSAVGVAAQVERGSTDSDDTLGMPFDTELVLVATPGGSLDEAASVSLTFGSDGLVRGNTGCNDFQAEFSLQDDGSMTLEPVLATRAICDDAAMRIERSFLASLAGMADGGSALNPSELLWAASGLPTGKRQSGLPTGKRQHAPAIVLTTALGETLTLVDPLAVDTATQVAGATPKVSLAGPTWVFDSFAGEAMPIERPPRLLFQEDGRLSLQGSCLDIGASYTVDGGKLAITGLESSPRECSDVLSMAFEQTLPQLLTFMTSWQIEGDELTLQGFAEELNMTFTEG